MTRDEPLVYIVDDDPSVRKAALRLFKSMEIHAQAFASARDFLDCELSDGPSCIVLDVRMPGLSGLQLQQTLAERQVYLPIIFLSGHGDISMAVDAIKKGAVDFLTKPFSDQKLLDAVQSAFTEHIHRLELTAKNAELRDKVASLTERERQVVDLVFQGLLNKQIAAELGISEVTVKSHRARVMEKMQAGSLAQLVRVMEQVHSSGEVR